MAWESKWKNWRRHYRGNGKGKIYGCWCICKMVFNDMVERVTPPPKCTFNELLFWSHLCFYTPYVRACTHTHMHAHRHTRRHAHTTPCIRFWSVSSVTTGTRPQGHITGFWHLLCLFWKDIFIKRTASPKERSSGKKERQPFALTPLQPRRTQIIGGSQERKGLGLRLPLSSEIFKAKKKSFQIRKEKEKKRLVLSWKTSTPGALLQIIRIKYTPHLPLHKKADNVLSHYPAPRGISEVCKTDDSHFLLSSLAGLPLNEIWEVTNTLTEDRST